MEIARYVLAVLLLVTLPGAIFFWLVIHPFIEFWRRQGMVAAYVVSIGLMILTAIVMYWFKDSLVGPDLGTNWWMFGAGLLMYLLTIFMETQLRRHLKLRTLVGVPELKGEAGNLLDQGIYRMVRHPRYLALMIGIVGYSLMVNYGGTFVLVALTIPAVFLLAHFEERELIRRFGDPYREYIRRVPQLIPTVNSFKAAFGK